MQNPFSSLSAQGFDFLKDGLISWPLSIIEAQKTHT